MTRRFFIIEKVIAGILVVWGAVLLYLMTNWFYIFFDGLLTLKNISILKALKVYHLIFLVPILFFAGGMLLLFNKKIGWIISLIALLTNAILFIVPPGKEKSMFDDRMLAMGFGAYILLSLATFIILAMPAYRTKYLANKKTWMIIVLISLLLLIDKTIFYFIS